MEERILTTTSIYQGHVVKLNVHDVQLPDGNTAKRELLQHLGAVAMIVVDAEQQVLLVRQYRIGAGEAMWEIPAGMLEADEDPNDCAVRELQEETGYKPLQMEQIGKWYTAPGFTTEQITLYWVKSFTESKLDGDVDEFIESRWFRFDKALEMVDTGEIQDAKTIIALLHIQQRLTP